MAKPDDNPGLSDVEDVNDDRDDEQPDDDVLDDDLDPDPSDEGDAEDGDEDDAEDGDDKPLGQKGEKALAAMKALVKDQKKMIRDLKAEVADLRKGDDDEDELTSAKKATETERSKRIEAEKKLAAKQAGLPDSWADRLKGDDFDDFLDDAEALAEDMPTPRSRKGGGGAKDGGTRKRKEPSLDDQIAEAEKAGDLDTARRLKAQKIHALRG